MVALPSGRRRVRRVADAARAAPRSHRRAAYALFAERAPCAARRRAAPTAAAASAASAPSRAAAAA